MIGLQSRSCECGVEAVLEIFADFVRGEKLSSAVHMFVEVFVAKGCSVEIYAMSMRATSAQDPIMQERHVLQWSYRYGAALDILHLLESSAANDDCPLPHSQETVPIHRDCFQSRRVVYRVRARRSPMSYVGGSLALASLLIHVVECCSALHICRRYTYGAMAAG
jgi:hypothetical protein